MYGSFTVLPRCAYRPSRADFSYRLRSKMQWAMTARTAKGRGRAGVRTHAAFVSGRAFQGDRHRGRRRFRRGAALPWRGPISAVDVHEEAPMEEAPVLVERRAGYRVITLNRPRQLNAFNEAMQQALKRALAEAEEDCDCRALLLTGAGRAFCAGQDLRERITAD